MLLSQQDAAAWLETSHEQGGRRPKNISSTLLEQAEHVAEEQRVANLPTPACGGTRQGRPQRRKSKKKNGKGSKGKGNKNQPVRVEVLCTPNVRVVT